MRKSWILPGAAVLGGLIGLLVRHRYLTTAFEPGTGLPIEGLPITAVSWVVVALVVLLLAVLSHRKPERSFDKQYTAAFQPTGFLSLTCRFASMALLLVAGFCNIEAYIKTFNSSGLRSLPIARPILGVLALLSAAGLYFTILEMKKKKEVHSVWLTLPGFTCALWVMASYQTWAQDPVLSRYLCSLLSVLLSLVACSFMAGFAFSSGRINLTLFVGTTAGSLGLMVLGDGLPLYDLTLVVAMVFYLLSMIASLAENAAKPILPDCSAGCPGGCSGCSGCGDAPTQP